jgi:hypothetical protein
MLILFRLKGELYERASVEIYTLLVPIDHKWKGPLC